MSTMSGGQAAVASLKAENVDHVFGLIGSATMEMFDALYDADDINFIGVHDENRRRVNPLFILRSQHFLSPTRLLAGK